MKIREIKNGRLAMVAFLGFTGQYLATSKGPIDNLLDHLKVRVSPFLRPYAVKVPPGNETVSCQPLALDDASQVVWRAVAFPPCATALHSAFRISRHMHPCMKDPIQ